MAIAVSMTTNPPQDMSATANPDVGRRNLCQFADNVSPNLSELCTSTFRGGIHSGGKSWKTFRKTHTGDSFFLIVQCPGQRSAWWLCGGFPVKRHLEPDGSRSSILEKQILHRFLVVDDLPQSTEVVGDWLKKSVGGEVVFAHDGVEAIDCLERQQPFDLILTDLRMPRLDGLGFLAVVRQRFPQQPVVIFTAHGNEEIAFHAIQGGAVSYVPKQFIPNRLAEVVSTVLKARARSRNRSRLATYLSSHELQFQFENDLSLLSAAVTELQGIAQDCSALNEHELTRIGVALLEALTNAMIHGNLEISSELRVHHDGAYETAIKTRQSAPEFRDRRVKVRCRFTPGAAEFEITDEGRGFDWTRLPDPCDPENLLKPSGRGLVLIRAFMDDVTFNEKGNQLRFVKRIQTANPAIPLN
jgi:CheY-like chemotaxis protein/anti-sigma regulatory factor (Ser/Thr protein kinase)